MCGIAGIFVPGERPENPRQLAGTVGEMLGYIAHRGPDEAGRMADGRAALGAVRLQIIDLAGGQQPLSDASGRYWIAYNGEVYNYPEIAAELRALGHVFRTASDTEVVLHAWMAWGPACLDRLNGGYAFAIYDRAKGELFLARDRFGKRPLFYVEHDGKLYFGSEMKTFLAIEDFAFEFDPEELAGIATVWTPVGDQTGFRRIRQLPGGCWMRWTRGGAGTPQQYWAFPVKAEPAATGFEEAAGQLRELLTDAVRIRLRSDVEVGAYLSGGLDSTITTALASSQMAGRTKAFGVSFEDQSFDESRFQQRAARNLGVEAHFIRIGARDVLGALPDALWNAEFPQFRSAFVPLYLLSDAVRDAGIKVVLTGEGADEIFFGYDIFKETLLRRDWHGLTADERTRRLLGLYPYLSLFSAENAAGLSRVFENFAGDGTAPLFSHLMRIDNGRFVGRFLTEPANGTSALEKQMVRAGIDRLEDGLRRAQWLEVRTLLEGYLLSSQGDRSSFAHGVEARCPFLDYRIAEWAARLPTSFGLSDEYGEKHLLKAAFGDIVDRSILERPKQPYRAPGASAHAALCADGQALPDPLEPYLSPAAIADTGVLRPNLVQNLLKKVRQTPPERISAREDQAFMFVTSLSILQKLFVEGEGHSRRRRFDRLVVDEVVAEPAA